MLDDNWSHKPDYQGDATADLQNTTTAKEVPVHFGSFKIEEESEEENEETLWTEAASETHIEVFKAAENMMNT